MKKKFKATIYAKLLIVCLSLLIIPSLVIGFQSYKDAKNELDEKGKVILKNSVKQVILLIDEKQKEVESGSISLEKAQEDVKEQILGKKTTDGTRPINREIDLGKSGYFWILDEKGNLLAHPTLEGESVWDSEDKSGTGFLFTQEYIKKALNGGGFTEYEWFLPNSEDTAQKIAYTDYDNNWGWVVASGAYMKDFNRGADKIKIVAIITLSISFAVGILIILLFARHISKPINRIKEAVESVASGDLTVEEIKVVNKDETGALADAINNMIFNLKDLIHTVKDSSNTVSKSSTSLNEIAVQTANATEEIAQTIAEIANSSTEQARDVEEGNVNINELGKDIENVAKLSDEMHKVSEQTNNLTQSGLEVVKTLTEKTEENNRAALKVNQVISKLNDNSKEIGVITETISQIAEQTNLLALNASIEAARAGDAGRGFAVVADEIRKLAEQASTSIKGINEILGDIRANSQVAVDSMAETKTIFEEQSKSVEGTKEIFDKISLSIHSLTNEMTKVTNSSIGMNNKKEQIISMIENLSAVTEQTAASTQEVSAASEEQTAAVQEVSSHAEELKNLSDELIDLINKFKI